MSDLTDNTVANTYKDLIQVGNSGGDRNNGVSTGALLSMQDGAGVNIPIAMNIGSSPAIILGMGGNSTATLSGNEVNLRANTTNSSNISMQATGSVDIEGQDIRVGGSSGMSLAFKRLVDAEAEGGILTTDLSATSLTWKPSGASAEERVLTESYVSYTGTATMSAEAVSEFAVNVTGQIGTLPIGTPGQQKIIIVNNTFGDLDVTSDGSTSVVNFGSSTGTAHLVKSSTTWMVVASSTT